VKVLFDRNSRRYEVPLERNLWEIGPEGTAVGSVVAPVDPDEFGIDPLTFL